MSYAEFLTRAFAPADLPTLHAIRAAAFAPIFASFRSIVGPEIAALGLATAEQEQADLLDAIAKLDSSHAIAIAESGSTVIGFVSWKNDPATKIGEITLNAVHPDYGGKGVGTALYEHALAALKAAGMQLATGREFAVRAGIPPAILNVDIGPRVHMHAMAEVQLTLTLPLWLSLRATGMLTRGVESPLPGAGTPGASFLVGLAYRSL